jgi:nucleoside-diphosphate kinase
MVWEGRDAVKTGRVLLGATNPLASAPGTIRGDYAIVRYCHRPLTFTRTLTE